MNKNERNRFRFILQSNNKGYCQAKNQKTE